MKAAGGMRGIFEFQVKSQRLSEVLRIVLPNRVILKRPTLSKTLSVHTHTHTALKLNSNTSVKQQLAQPKKNTSVTFIKIINVTFSCDFNREVQVKQEHVENIVH